MAGTPGPSISQHPSVAARQLQQDYLLQFNAAANAPIPGLTSPLRTTTQIPGMVGIAPPQQQFQPQQMSPGFQAGPYGRQALGLAGLLSMGNTPGGYPVGSYPGGLLGGKRPFFPGGK